MCRGEGNGRPVMRSRLPPSTARMNGADTHRRVPNRPGSASGRVIQPSANLSTAGPITRGDTNPETPSARRLCRTIHLTAIITTVQRRRPWRPRLGTPGRQSKVPQDALHDLRLVDERDEPQPAAAPGTLEHVDPKRPPHQLRPEIAIPSPTGGIRARLGGLRHRRRAGPLGARRCDDRRPPWRARREDAVIEHQVGARPRDQHGQPFQERCRFESQMRRSVLPLMAQRETDLPLGVDPQPCQREWWA